MGSAKPGDGSGHRNHWAVPFPSVLKEAYEAPVENTFASSTQQFAPCSQKHAPGTMGESERSSVLSTGVLAVDADDRKTFCAAKTLPKRDGFQHHKKGNDMEMP